MRIGLLFAWSALLLAFIPACNSHAAAPADFNETQLEAIWNELWKSGDVRAKQPQLENLSTNDVIKKMAGKWTVMFGVTPDQVSIVIRTNETVVVSGRKDGKDWKKTGEWRVTSNKLILYLEKDSLPSFIFRTQNRDYIFDPWAKGMMSGLRREQ